jgi:hypothetical protein
MTKKVNKGPRDCAEHKVVLKGGPLSGTTVYLSNGTGTLNIVLKGQRGSYTATGLWEPAP